MSLLRPPLPKKARRSYTYEEWYGMYYDEINQIVDEIIECIMGGFCSPYNPKNEKLVETSHSMNIAAFSEKLKHRLYETSDNRFKDTDGMWQS